MKFIHTSDLHLCSNFSQSSLPASTAAAQRVQLWKTFKNIIDTTLVQKADMLLISGDLFDSANAKITDYKRAADAFASIPDTRVFICCGNHDPLNSESLYNFVSFPKNVFIFPNYFTKVELGDVSIYGYSWDKNSYKAPEFTLAKEPDEAFSILMLHADVFDENSRYLPISPKLIETLGYNYTALGHIHKPTNISDTIRYCGSPEPLDFSETGSHGFILGDTEGGKLSLKFINAAAREFISGEAELNGEMNYNDITEIIEAVCGKETYRKLCKISLSGTLDPKISIAAIAEELSDEFAYLCIEDNTVVDYDIEELRKDNAGNIIGEYIDELYKLSATDAVAKKALYYGIEALLGGGAGGVKKK